ncbi:unnamed protein product [Prorocentrum cordatum]|uniref:Fungal lipase-like domain-containing protein n=1 Tax=Prorocentrum cordatum TaxID=2364126 RepID=A0ABN9VW04_9DINO|nr:unnamed protein product [Polarella glacialis]
MATELQAQSADAQHIQPKASPPPPLDAVASRGGAGSSFDGPRSSASGAGSRAAASDERRPSLATFGPAGAAASDDASAGEPPSPLSAPPCWRRFFTGSTEGRMPHTLRSLRASWFVRILKVYHVWAFTMAIVVIVGMAASTFLSLFLLLMHEMQARHRDREVLKLEVDDWPTVLVTFTNTLLYCLVFVSCGLRAVWLIKDCISDDMFIDYRRTVCCEGAGPGTFPIARTNEVSVSSHAERQRIHRALADDGTLMEDLFLERFAGCLFQGSKLLLEKSMEDKEHKDDILSLELDPPAVLVFRVTARPAAFRGEGCKGRLRAVLDVLWQCCIYFTLDVLPVLWALLGSTSNLGTDDGGPEGRFVDAAVLVACAHTVFYFCWSTVIDYVFKALVLAKMLFPRPVELPSSHPLSSAAPSQACLRHAGSTSSESSRATASRHESFGALTGVRSRGAARLDFLGQAREVLGACPEQVLGAARRPPGREDELNLCVCARNRFSGDGCSGLLLVYLVLAGVFSIAVYSRRDPELVFHAEPFVFAFWLSAAVWALLLLRYRLGAWVHGVTASMLREIGQPGSSSSFGQPFGAASVHWSLCFLIHCGVMPMRIVWKSALIMVLSLGLFAVGTTLALKSIALVVGTWAFFLFFIAYFVPDHLWKIMVINLLLLAAAAMAAMADLHGWAGVRRTALLILLTQMGAWRERGHQSHRVFMALFFVLLVGIAGTALYAASEAPGTVLPGANVHDRSGPQFVFPLVADRRKNYPFCGFSWPMAQGDNVSRHCGDDRLSLVDFARMSQICYTDDKETKRELDTFFPGWEVNRTEQKGFDDLSFLHLSRGKTHVVAVRGTMSLYDILQDLNIWMPTAILQLASLAGPHIPAMSRILEGVTVFAGWLEDPASYSQGPNRVTGKRKLEGLLDYLRHMKHHAEEGSVFYTVGHSLGGGYAQLAGAVEENITAVTFSAPGLHSTRRIFDPSPSKSALRRAGVNVVPDNDPVPKVDAQVGTVLKIDCGGSAVGCHSIMSTLCELSAACGAAGGRPAPRNYTFWCSECEASGQSGGIPRCAEQPRPIVA